MKKRLNAVDGDFAIIRDGEGFVFGVFSGGPSRAIVGDVERVTDPSNSHFIPAHCLLPGAGVLLGSRVESKAEACDALRPFSTPAWYALIASAPTLAGEGGKRQ